MQENKKLCLQGQNIDKHNDNGPTLVVNDATQPKGFKHRPSLKRNNQT